MGGNQMRRQESASPTSILVALPPTQSWQEGTVKPHIASQCHIVSDHGRRLGCGFCRLVMFMRSHSHHSFQSDRDASRSALFLAERKGNLSRWQAAEERTPTTSAEKRHVKPSRSKKRKIIEIHLGLAAVLANLQTKPRRNNHV